MENKKTFQKISTLYPIAKGIRFAGNVKEGYLSQNYILQNSEQKFFLKQYSAKYSLEMLKDIHKVKFFFGKSGIPVILPYEDLNGGTIFEDNGRYYALFPFVVGKILVREELFKKEITCLGKLLAKVHGLSKNGVPLKIKSGGKTWDSKKFFLESNLLLEKIENISEKKEFDKLALKVLKKKIEIVKSNKLLLKELGLENNHLLHGDFHEQNVFFNNDNSIKNLFDWEKTCIGARVFELVRAIDYVCLNGNYGNKNIEDAVFFLKAYYEEYPIEKDEFYKGVTFFYLKKAHSLWIETNHYINNTERSDELLKKELLTLNYYEKGYSDLVIRLYQGMDTLKLEL